MKDTLINLLRKGRLHHIYFFSAISVSDHGLYDGDELYDAFTGYKTGIHFGGIVESSPVLNYDYVPYGEQSNVEAPGIGLLPGVMSEDDTAKIVVPLARR